MTLNIAEAVAHLEYIHITGHVIYILMLYTVHPYCVVIGFMAPPSSTLWGVGYGECTTCKLDNSPAWTCSAAVSAYADIGGADADIIELDGEDGETNIIVVYAHIYIWGLANRARSRRDM